MVQVKYHECNRRRLVILDNVCNTCLDTIASDDDGMQPFSCESRPQSPLFARSADVGETNSRYSNQSLYEHMPYISSTSGMVSHADEPCMSYGRTGWVVVLLEEHCSVYSSNSIELSCSLVDSGRLFST